MEKIYGRPALYYDRKLSYCPGCTHGIAHKLVAECIDELGIADKVIGVCGIGCSYFGAYIKMDMIGAAHGRAPATATGVKACRPDEIVITYQGDGDCSSIGAAETLHAAGRGEKITTIMINNGVYGMTGGQKAPTTLLNQRTTTTQDGRQAERDGYPMREAEILAAVPGAYYVARGALNNPANVKKAKTYIKKAIQAQMDGHGYNFVELLSTCPTNWGLSPVEALARVEKEMIPYYPLGEKVVEGKPV
ncbi:MAG: thiamine pyrophosphate-dependent enzyme [bacterium]|jgi:2-oxoglutarate ferredoxin oxidoreductase subunit beta